MEWTPERKALRAMMEKHLSHWTPRQRELAITVHCSVGKVRADALDELTVNKHREFWDFHLTLSQYDRFWVYKRTPKGNVFVATAFMPNERSACDHIRKFAPRIQKEDKLTARRAPMDSAITGEQP